MKSLNFFQFSCFSFKSTSFAISHRAQCLVRTFASMPKADTPPGFKPLKETKLFSPFKLGRLTLEHRIVQAPLTRMRSTKESDGVNVPNDLNIEYYSQRANKGGLQLTEATDIFKYAR